MTFLTGLAATALLLPTIALGAVQLNRDDDAPPSAIVPAASAPSAAPASGSIPTTEVDLESRSTTAFSTSGPAPAEAQRPPPAGRWSWPLVPRPEVGRGFRVDPSPWSPGHRGVDLMTEPGAEIRAPASGTVRFAGVIAGRPVLSIDHGDGLISSFEPVISPLRRGQLVQQSDGIGRLGNGPTHCAPAACLHWGVRANGRYIDPLLLVPGMRGPAVLLPLLPP
jgi:murein DD-endopeptidase MepM/ murein hydrolase activator NlpD